MTLEKFRAFCESYPQARRFSTSYPQIVQKAAKSGNLYNFGRKYGYFGLFLAYLRTIIGKIHSKKDILHTQHQFKGPSCEFNCG